MAVSTLCISASIGILCISASIGILSCELRACSGLCEIYKLVPPGTRRLRNRKIQWKAKCTKLKFKCQDVGLQEPEVPDLQLEELWNSKPQEFENHNFEKFLDSETQQLKNC